MVGKHKERFSDRKWWSARLWWRHDNTEYDQRTFEEIERASAELGGRLDALCDRLMESLEIYKETCSNGCNTNSGELGDNGG